MGNRRTAHLCAGTSYPKVKIKKEHFKNQLKMQIDINNIQQMVADAVRDAVAPLYEQMREIENKYYPNEKDNEKTE